MKRLYEAIKRLFDGAQKSDTKHTNPGCFECKHCGGFRNDRCMSEPFRYATNARTGRTPIYEHCDSRNADLRCPYFEQMKYIDFLRLTTSPSERMTPAEVKRMLDGEEPIKGNKIFNEYDDIYHKYRILRLSLSASSSRWQRIDDVRVTVSSGENQCEVRSYHSFPEFAKGELEIPIEEY